MVVTRAQNKMMAEEERKNMMESLAAMLKSKFDEQSTNLCGEMLNMTQSVQQTTTAIQELKSSSERL